VLDVYTSPGHGSRSGFQLVYSFVEFEDGRLQIDVVVASLRVLRLFHDETPTCDIEDWICGIKAAVTRIECTREADNNFGQLITGRLFRLLGEGQHVDHVVGCRCSHRVLYLLTAVT